eukprot:c6896_g1_i2.p1 GENE.c6896_g1_i2~~c6896_g1_i2.p1  ORF type:complete len:504 (-),score=104.58 c6896_g1_i2:34-1386(-)
MAKQSKGEPERPLPEMHQAAGRNDCGMILMQLSQGTSVDLRTVDRGATALHHAAFYGMYAAAATLLEHGANVHAKDILGRVPLHLAAHSRNRFVIKLILRYGGNPRDKDTRGGTPDSVWDKKKDKELIEWYKRVLNPGRNASFSRSEIKLLYAVESCNELKVLEKLAKKRPIDVCGTDSIFALTIAVRAEAADIVELLCAHCVDANQPDNKGTFPLHWAALAGSTRIASILLDNFALINVPTFAAGYTALHLTASKGFLDTTNLLLDRGASCNALDNAGMTPLHWSVKNDHPVHMCVKKLVQPGCDAAQIKLFEGMLAVLLALRREEISARNLAKHTPLQCVPYTEALVAGSVAERTAITLAKAGADLRVLVQLPVSKASADLCRALRLHLLAEMLPVPDGWQIKATETIRRRKYYVHRKQKITQWVDPRVAILAADDALREEMMRTYPF